MLPVVQVSRERKNSNMTQVINPITGNIRGNTGFSSYDKNGHHQTKDQYRVVRY